MVERPGESRATRVTRMLLWGTGALIVVEAGLGAIGQLRVYVLFGVLLVLAIAVTALAWRRPPRAAAMRDPLSPLEVALVAALLAAVLIPMWAGWHRTTFLYDTLSYHLHVPATWAHDERLSIVPAVFGDPSSAYAPSNLELVFTLLLMRPAYSASLAVVGQAPFAALAAAAIVAAVREAGGRRLPALAAALAFLLIPEVWGQIATAMTDLGLAAFLLASLPFARRLWHAPRLDRRDLLAFATAIGLAIGTKYAGATLAVPFAVVAAVALARRRAARRRSRRRAGDRRRARDGRLLVRAQRRRHRQPVLPGGRSRPVAAGALRRRRDARLGLPRPDRRSGGVRLDAARRGRRLRQRRRRRGCAPVAQHRSGAAAGPAGDLLVRHPVPGEPLPVRAARRRRDRHRPRRRSAARAGRVVRPRDRDRRSAAASSRRASASSGSDRRRRRGRCALPWRRLAFQPNASPGADRRRRGRSRCSLVGRRRVRAGSVRVATSATTVSPTPGPGSALMSSTAPPPTQARTSPSRSPAGTWSTASPTSTSRARRAIGCTTSARRGDGTAEPAPYRRGAEPRRLARQPARHRHRTCCSWRAMDPIVRRTIAADGDGFPVERAWADARPRVFQPASTPRRRRASTR